MTSTIQDRFNIVPEEGVKAPCRMATDVNITLSGLQTIDSVAGSADDRVLVRSQTDASENGIYVMQLTAWVRASDWDDNTDVISGMLVSTSEGTAYSNAVWHCTFTGVFSIDTTLVAFSTNSLSVGEIKIYATKAQMVADTSLSPGDTAKFQGYLDANGLGGSEGIVKTASQASSDGDVIDEKGAGFTLDNGNVWVLKGESFTAEQFGAGLGLSNALESASIDAAFVHSEGRTLAFHGGKTYRHNTNIVVPKEATVWAVGAVIQKQTSDQGPGHFIGVNGDKSDISNPIPITNIHWYGGDIDVNSFSGVNGFGIEVVDGFTVESAIARNCVHDAVTEGGRGFTRHGHSRNVQFLNCRSVNCSHGFDESWKSDNLISVSVTGATSANPVVITMASHSFTNGKSAHVQQMTGDFNNLNGHDYVIANVTATTIELTGADGSGFGAYVSNGVISLADAGAQRNRGNSMIGCTAELCEISALTMIQANNSRDLELSSCDNHISGFKAINCGTEHTAEWGVINSSASVGIIGDIQVFNDAAHPVGAVFRGSMHKWMVDAVVNVHTCDSIIDASPLISVNGLDGGINSSPEAIMQENKFDITYSGVTVNTALVTSTNISGSIDFMFRNDITIRLSRPDYVDSTEFSGALVTNATHFTNHGRFLDLPSGREVSFFFNKPIPFSQAGKAVTGLTIDGATSSRADLDLDMGGTAASARIQANTDNVLKGYWDFNKSDNRWRMFMNSAVQYQFTNNSILPGFDGTLDLGSAGLRMDVIYAVTGTINTSDEREKTELLDYEAAEVATAIQLKSLIRKFKFKDAVELKGDGARIHFGIGAQSVIQCFSDNGLDATEYAMLCYDEWVDEYMDVADDETGEITVVQTLKAGNRYGVRYEELLAFIIGAM